MGLIIGLLVLWVVLAVIGFVVKSLFWLAIVGIILFAATKTSFSGVAAARDRPAPGRGNARTASGSQRRRPRSSVSGSGGGACPRLT